MEGVCFNMKSIQNEFKKITEDFSGVVIASGGFIRSSLWIKMMASILNTPLLIPKHKGYQSSIGAAIMAGIGTGIYHTLQEAVDAVVCFEEQMVEPDNKWVQYYAEKYFRFQELIKCHL
jgi:sugar (pentulose or hexulose) kinase